MSSSSPEDSHPESPQLDRRPPVRRIRRWFNRFRRLLGLAIWLLIAIGLTVRFSVRDLTHKWDLVYYATPIASLPIWVFLAWLLGWYRTKERSHSTQQKPRTLFCASRISLILGILFVFWTIYSQVVFRAAQPSPDDLRIVFWNTARVQAGPGRIASQVNTFQPVCFGLVEADRNHELDLVEWQKNFPEYKIYGTKFGGLIGVKGDLLSQNDVSLRLGSRCKQFDLRVNGLEFTLVLVDVASDLRRSRRIPLSELAAFVERLNDRPVVIMGDFNTPDDSALFEPLRKQFRMAFRERGSGYAATWPMPLPVLTLDQVWFNEGITLSQCLHGWTIYSDHRPVICDFSITETP